MELCSKEAKIMYISALFESCLYYSIHVPQRLLPELAHCEREKLIRKQNSVQLILFSKLRSDPCYFTPSTS